MGMGARIPMSMGPQHMTIEHGKRRGLPSFQRCFPAESETLDR